MLFFSDRAGVGIEGDNGKGEKRRGKEDGGFEAEGSGRRKKRRGGGKKTMIRGR